MGSDPNAGPCVGEAIMTKPCNDEPCPPQAGEEEEGETLPLKIEMKRVSTRP